MTDHTSPWLIFDKINDPDNIYARLFCFHYAGSGGSIFLPWVQSLPKETELVAIQLPGREYRFDEPLLYDMREVTAQLSDALVPFLDKPYAFFGHSLGALIAFDLARVLRNHGLQQPALLMVSGQNAPQVKSNLPTRLQLSDEEFIQVIRECKGTPEAILQNDMILEFLLPRLRADNMVYENYLYEEQEPLDCRIVAFYGQEDSRVDDTNPSEWHVHTGQSFQYYRFPGDHFFLHDHEEALLQHICNELRFLRNFEAKEKIDS